MPDRALLGLALLLGLAVLAVPDAGEPAEGTTVVLALPSLPLTGNTQLDRGEIAHLAGCIDTAVITIGDDPGRGYTVIVRCRVPVVPGPLLSAWGFMAWLPDGRLIPRAG